MKILFRHPVAGQPQAVFERFDGELLRKLKPFFMRMKFIRYDGQEVGDRVELTAWLFGVIRQDWVNIITEHVVTEDRCFFVDEGLIMPSGMTFWRHRHIVEREGTHSAIVDDIEFTTGKRWKDYLLYPGIWLVFRIRKPVYLRHFGKA